MSRVGIVVALATEARALRSTIARGSTSCLFEDGTLLAISGIGRASAARAARGLLEAGAQGLVSFGLAGGLDPMVPAGTIFLPTEVISGEGACYVTAIGWRKRLAAALTGHRALTAGKLLTSGTAIAAADAKARAFAETGALAVDMESTAIAQTAVAGGVPFLAARVIVDTAQDTLPSAVVSANQDGEVRIGRLLGALLRNPADVVGMIHLAARFRVANRALRAVAAVDSLRNA